MKNNVHNTFINVIETLKKDKNTKSIILVGSSKDKLEKYKKLENDYRLPDSVETEDNNINLTINDIDLFIIVENQEEDQIRQIKNIDNIEFDMNFISIKGCQNFIESKTYFFLKIKDGKLLYDVDNLGKEIMKLCEEKYKEGPDKISLSDKKFQAEQLISDISRLEKIDDYDDFEYEFLIYMYLSKVIKLFYIINDNWVPKDKKLLKSLKKDEPYLYELASQVQGHSCFESKISFKDESNYECERSFGSESSFKGKRNCESESKSRFKGERSFESECNIKDESNCEIESSLKNEGNFRNKKYKYAQLLRVADYVFSNL